MALCFLGTLKYLEAVWEKFVLPLDLKWEVYYLEVLIQDQLLMIEASISLEIIVLIWTEVPETLKVSKYLFSTYSEFDDKNVLLIIIKLYSNSFQLILHPKFLKNYYHCGYEVHTTKNDFDISLDINFNQEIQCRESRT